MMGFCLSSKGVIYMPSNKDVLNALGEWVVKTTEKGHLATPEEITALPKVAELFLANYSVASFSSATKKE